MTDMLKIRTRHWSGHFTPTQSLSRLTCQSVWQAGRRCRRKDINHLLESLQSICSDLAGSKEFYLQEQFLLMAHGFLVTSPGTEPRWPSSGCECPRWWAWPWCCWSQSWGPRSSPSHPRLALKWWIRLDGGAGNNNDISSLINTGIDRREEMKEGKKWQIGS